MSEASSETDAATKPLWRRVVDFPLVALVVAIAVYALTMFLMALVLGMVAGYMGKSGQAAPDKEAIEALLAGPYLIPATLVEIVFSVAVYKLVIRHLGTWPRDDLRLNGAVRDLGHGLLAGALIFSLVVGVAAAIGVYRIVGPGGWTSFLTILFSMGIGPGFREELMFRGILFRFLEEFGGSWAALLITSALFGLAHIQNHDATLFSSFAIAMEAGLLLGAVYMLTRNLWMAMGLHAAWNVTQGFVWDVPVSGFDVHGLVTARLDGPALLSGGGFGLEASLIALVLATSLGLFYLKKAIDRGHLEQPWWVRRRRQAAAIPA